MLVSNLKTYYSGNIEIISAACKVNLNERRNKVIE